MGSNPTFATNIGINPATVGARWRTSGRRRDHHARGSEPRLTDRQGRRATGGRSGWDAHQSRGPAASGARHRPDRASEALWEAVKRGPDACRRDRAEPLARPTRGSRREDLRVSRRRRLRPDLLGGGPGWPPAPRSLRRDVARVHAPWLPAPRAPGPADHGDRGALGAAGGCAGAHHGGQRVSRFRSVGGGHAPPDAALATRAWIVPRFHADRQISWRGT